MNMSMETSKKLDMEVYPTLRLFMNKEFVSDSNSSSVKVNNDPPRTSAG